MNIRIFDKYEVNNWVKLFDLDGCIITDNLNNAGYMVFYHDYKREQTINIHDLGKGHARLIQLLLAIASKIFILRDEDSGKRKSKAEQNQTIIHIEEPEAFMHPKWQSKLADLFVLINKNHHVQFLIETHSVYLIQKLQLLVARKEIEPSEISLLYFDEDKKDTPFRKINIRKDGILKESFGEGFYDESAQLSIELLNIESFN